MAWGELESKETYTLDNYRFSDGNFFSPSKYIVDIGKSQTETDHKKVLDASDDIATVTLGDSWRMPTYAEIDELANKLRLMGKNVKVTYF